MTLIPTLDSALALDLDELLQRGLNQARRSHRETLVTVTLPLEDLEVEPFDLFARAGTLVADRYFWSPPEHALTLVGLGAAHAIEATQANTRFRQAAEAWQALLEGALTIGPQHLRGVGPLLLGGFAFDSTRPATELWRGYPAGRLVLPRLMVTYAAGEAWLTYNAVLTEGSDAEAEAQALHDLRQKVLEPSRSNPQSASSPRVILQRELRPAADWQADVAQAAQTIQSGQLEKVVLARAVELQATTPFEAGQALHYLSEHYRGCYIFAVARDEKCFLGATPERLARLDEGEILTMSLAGSIRRGLDPAEDERLGQALLDSAKDRYEHAVVVQAMVESLEEVSAALNVSAGPSLLKLGNIQHICTTITGEIAPGRTIFDLVEALNPTPAVGGRPREASLQLIRQCEKLDRGWYAGPVGWVDAAGDGEFAVALRSALLKGHIATLFAGCGIMADSDPEHEYAESVLKLKPMLAALGL